MGLVFKTTGEPPGQQEAETWHKIAERWPELWSHVLESLKRDLQFDSSDEQAEFFAAILPDGCLFDVLSAGVEKWQISVQPEYSCHILLVSMLGMSYEGYSMDG